MKLQIFTLNLYFNGEFYILKTYKLLNLKNLLRFFNINKNVIVLEYNGKIINSRDWKNILLKNNDKIELLTIVGGG